MIPFMYTNSDAVLGVAGLTSEDISDEELAKRNFAIILSVELHQSIPAHKDIYIPPQTAGTTDDERFNSNCLVLFCTYYLAAKLLMSVPGIFLRETDGQSEYQRHDIDYEKLAANFIAEAEKYKQTLLENLNTINAIAPVQLLTVVTPNYDPVTG